MRVAVIMSTFNGERYVKEQIESILSQCNVEVELYVRDDGSSDNTLNILKEYESTYDNIHLDIGSNIGFRQSFISELIKHSGFDYYAFSDQDDYWEKDKLSHACFMINSQNKKDIPIVYYSNLKIADENLRVFKTTQLEHRKQSLESVIMRRSIAGCTIVMNKAMWQKISDQRITDQMLRRGHDSFIISLCYSIGGLVICDENAFIRYRQHKDNTSGGIDGFSQRLRKEWRALIQKKGQEAEMAGAILEGWKDYIDDRQRSVLMTIANSNRIKERFKIILSKDYCTGDLRLTVLGKVKTLLGYL